MKAFFTRMGEKFLRFMQGRRGPDHLYRFGCILLLLLLLVNLWVRHWAVSLAALAMVAWILFRFFSKNLPRRAREERVYLKIRNILPKKVKLWKAMFRDRKTHRYLTCPTCRCTIRIRKPDKGHLITVTCPKCSGRFDRQY